MANAFKLTSQVATNAMLKLLKNNLVWGKNVSTKYSKNFGKSVDPIGNTFTIRRAQEFVTTDGPTFTNQDVVTGSATVNIDKHKHVDLTWQTQERELSVGALLEDSVLQGKMAALAQQVESDIADQALEFHDWVGTPGQVVNSATDFLQAPQRLDEKAVPSDNRIGILPPADFYATGGSFTAQTFFGNGINDRALTNMRLPLIGSIQPYMAQTALTITTGDRAATGTVDGASQNVNYVTAKDGYTQTLDVAGLGAAATVSRGETFTIAGVFAVNPRTRQPETYLREFVVIENATADGSGDATITISPPIIAPTGTDETLRTNQAFQTVNAVPADTAVVTWKGAADTTYKLNCAYQKDALQLAFVPPARPHTGEFSYASDAETGITIRNWAFSDGVSDTHQYRCDILYGVTNYDRRLGVKFSGTA